MTQVICIGECMVELRTLGATTLDRGVAGDAYNAAVYMKRSAPKLQIKFATAIGSDPLSITMREAWRAEGIDDSLAFSTAGKQPGLYLIETDANGERRFHYWRSESAARRWFHEIVRKGGATLFKGADLVFLSGISLAILTPAERRGALNLLISIREGGARIAFDPNYRPQLWENVQAARDVVEEMVSIADIVLPSVDDIEQLFAIVDPNAQMDFLKRLGAREVAITTGPGRCLLFTGRCRWIDGDRASAVIDTSGAGDSFNGAYLASRLLGSTPEHAARAGLALAAKVVQARGAIIPAENPGPER